MVHAVCIKENKLDQASYFTQSYVVLLILDPNHMAFVHAGPMIPSIASLFGQRQLCFLFCQQKSWLYLTDFCQCLVCSVQLSFLKLIGADNHAVESSILGGGVRFCSFLQSVHRQ